MPRVRVLVLPSMWVGSTHRWRSRPRLAAGWLLIGALASAPTLATAQPTSATETSDDAPKRTKILVLLATGDDDMQHALDAARAQLAARGIDLEPIGLSEGTAPTRSIARELTLAHAAEGAYWFDRSRQGEVGVFLAAHDGSTFVRRIPVGTESNQAGLEAVFLIVEHSSAALAAGARIAMEMVPARATAAEPLDAENEADPIPQEPPPVKDEPDDPPPTPSPTTEPYTRLGVWAAYRGEAFASGVPWQSGAEIGAHLDVGRWLRLGVDYGFAAPWIRSALPVTWRHGPALHVGVRSTLTSHLEIAGRLVGALELVHWQSTDSDGLGFRLVGVVGADLLLRIRLSAGAFFELGPGVGVVLNRFAFVECEASSTSCDEDSRRVLVDPWRFRPRFHAGVGYRF